jgi:hypothetical protein
MVLLRLGYISSWLARFYVPASGNTQFGIHFSSSNVETARYTKNNWSHSTKTRLSIRRDAKNRHPIWCHRASEQSPVENSNIFMKSSALFMQLSRSAWNPFRPRRMPPHCAPAGYISLVGTHSPLLVHAEPPSLLVSSNRQLGRVRKR